MSGSKQRKLKNKQSMKIRKSVKPTQHIQWRGHRVTQFEARVYELISLIPRGKVSTYGKIATALNSGPRCVGQALRKNPLAPEVPCHRIVAGSLTIGGYKGSTGEDSVHIVQKRKILSEEGVQFTLDYKVDPLCVHSF